ncbi:hypothetical protein EJ08DRAFT_96276 [Tothia fuscella]|uniref:Arrestin C-terminal-like domain-containing protein n=1 Tax=Tothia fuscella TaxID=1048955 RepID=A0A9P4NVU2_9PEZI|nr:hypothetical protein EJ08DRAFT_96276 [Tothia fuscella]
MDILAQTDHPPPTPWSAASAPVPPPAPPWSNATRPLSDIRELTEPNLTELNSQNLENSRRPSMSRRRSLNRKPSITRQGSARKPGSLRELSHGRNRSITENITGLEGNANLTPEVQADRSSAYSLSLENVPPRSSSRQAQSQEPSKPNSQPLRPCILPPPSPHGKGHTIPNRGRSQSPVKEMVAQMDPAYSDIMHRAPSRTFIRTLEPNYDVLEFPKHQHPRILAELHVNASLFVGGGSVEGDVRITVDDMVRVRHRRQLAVSRVSIDLLGVEEMSCAKRNVFLNLATELIDSENPPPHNMVESLKQMSPIDPFWLVTPSVSTLPFMLSLPLDVGPPPFDSKHAKIRYVLCVTVLVRVQGKQYLVRRSQEICILSVYDPEKALMSLPSPLTASDEYTKHREHGIETIKVTAGLHRQVWVSGTSIFVDVHIANDSKKSIKKLELQLERDILCYKHAAATTLEKSASQARIFDSNERSILNKSVLKPGLQGWKGVLSHSSDIRTCDLELPRGHATVKCGKFFEVRYFLNVVACTSHNKAITVQLPIVLIHMNSLDVVPNSVAQVAAAIEEKRLKKHQRNRSQSHPQAEHLPTRSIHSPSKLARKPSSTTSVQGRAFSAPRKQSLDRIRAEADELCELGKLLDTSPRRYFYSPRKRGITSRQTERSETESVGYRTPPANRRALVLSDDLGGEVANIRARLRRMRSNETNKSVAPSIQQRDNEVSAPRRRTSVRSTGGSSTKVGFRELEVGIDAEIPAPSPSRFDALSAASGRQSQFRKMKSGERWRGPSWFTDRKENRSRERSREQSRERDYRAREAAENQKMLTNWI